MKRTRTKVVGPNVTPLSDEMTRSPSRGSPQPKLDPNHAFAKTARRRSAKAAVKKAQRTPSGRNPVLIVDDVTDVTEMLALFLKHAGYDVTTANSADTALRLARDRNFKLIISDIGMPEMNGYELAESLRALSHYKATPLIAITGYTEYDDKGQALRAGFNAHLTKPINPSQLLNLIKELLS